jgi:hypothetical protein
MKWKSIFGGQEMKPGEKKAEALFTNQSVVGLGFLTSNKVNQFTICSSAVVFCLPCF